MSRHHQELDPLFDEILAEIVNDTPDDATVRAAGDRVWARLQAERDALAETPVVNRETTVRGCAGVVTLIPAFVRGELPEAQAILVQEHTRECLGCRRALLAERGQIAAAPVAESWQAPAARNNPSRFGRRFLLAAAALVGAVGLGGLLWSTFDSASADVAQVQSIDGGLYLVGAAGNRALRAGDEIAEGDLVRTAQGGSAVVVLADGSRVEMRERSEMAVKKGRTDTTIDLDQGSVIVEAAKRSRGHLFVDTADCRVAVTGTIFSVNHGTKGSRVSVIEGQVRVEHGKKEDLLLPGGQVTTRLGLTPIPVASEISWSRNADRYAALLAELDSIQREIRATVSATAPRTSTRLLDLVPAETVLYGAVPNIAESVSEARRVFQDRLAQSPVLADLLARSGAAPGQQQEIDALVARMRAWGAYLGPEVVVAGIGGAQRGAESAVVLAEVADAAGFHAFVEAEIAAEPEGDRLVLVDDPAAQGPGDRHHLYLWIGQGLAVASPEPRHLAEVAAGAVAGGTGFRERSLHTTLAAAYEQGVEWLFAADLERLLDQEGRSREDLATLGFESARHAVGRWSEEAGQGTVDVTFDGPRHGVASWLAEPAPMGSLEYISADALGFATLLVRDPIDIVNEILPTLVGQNGALEELARIETELGIDLRQDLAAALGGELAFALEPPLAPKPGGKLIAEVYDAARLQASLVAIVERISTELEAKGKPGLRIETDATGGRTLYRVVTTTGTTLGAYTFTDSYLLAGTSVALVDGALATKATGTNVTTTTRFQELLPTDGFSNFSALAFQDIGSRLAPLAQTLSSTANLTADQRQALEAASHLSPSALAYAYGGEDRLTFAASLGTEGRFSLAALLGTGGLTAPGGIGALLATEGLGGDAPPAE
jgi:ferric-dicitrate binding protein FerR (iron transport regulator)